MTIPSAVRKHLVAAVLVGLALRLFFVWRFSLETPDSKIYTELARNWLHHGVYGLFLGGQLTPVDIRVPGYPAFLAAIYAVCGSERLPVLLVQTLLDLATCFLIAALAARLAPKASRIPTTAGALWLAALCPFTANYTAVLLTETLATFLTTLALLVLLVTYEGGAWHFVGFNQSAIHFQPWILGGLIVGLGTLIRPETPLLLVAVALVLGVRWRRPADWPKLVRAGLWMAAGLFLALLPWAARNWHTLHRIQFLAPRYAELPGEYVPRGFQSWTKTWLVRMRDVYLVPWKLEEEPIPIEDLPDSAFDSAEERARVAGLFERHNTELTVSPAMDSEFARLAQERTGRHPLRTYLWIPIRRVATMWFTPRVELLPYSGHLWPPGQKWEEDPVDFLVTVGFGLLNFVYVGLALAGTWRWRKQPGVTLLVAFILVRTAFLTQVEAPEPRYVLVCFPAILTLAALVWAEPQANARLVGAARSRTGKIDLAERNQQY